MGWLRPGDFADDRGAPFQLKLLLLIILLLLILEGFLSLLFLVVLKPPCIGSCGTAIGRVLGVIDVLGHGRPLQVCA